VRFQTSVLDIIKKRQSRRNYLSVNLDNEIIKKIEYILQDNAKGPYGNKASFSLIEKRFAKENHKVKLGTYGFISGARYFIIGLIKDSKHANEDYGYLLETIILRLTEMGLGTCWLGGTFKRSDYFEIFKFEKDIIIPSITPLGIIDNSRSVKDNIIRWGAKSDKRKSWSEIFFSESFDTPLSKEIASGYLEPLEMLRLAPSASNKQPWRIVRSSEAYNFYLKRNSGYKRKNSRVDLQKVDMGIAMSHFELACKELKMEGEWQNMNPDITSSDSCEYCISWKY